MIQELRTAFWVLSIGLMTYSACGPDTAQTEDGASTTTGDDASSTDSPTDSPTGSSTGAPEPCSRVHEGDLYVLEDTDLTSLADIGRVAGQLAIFMGERDQRDLSFLSCLHTIDDKLVIDMNSLLESTEGLENLRSVKVVSITNNRNLRMVAGFNQIRELVGLVVRVNPAIEEIQLDSIETATWVQIGQCSGIKGTASHLALVDLSGFSGLTMVRDLGIEGNEALMSVDLLDALAANGGVTPLTNAIIRFNQLLPETAVHERLDALGVQNRDVCGNANGDPECFCEVDG